MTDNAGFWIFILSVACIASTDLVDWIADKLEDRFKDK